MTQTPSFPLREHPAFCVVSDASVSRLERECNVFRFDLGGQLSDPNEIPARILVILQGRPGWSDVTTADSPRWVSSALAV